MSGPLSTAPWRRAPLLLLRHPVVFLALFASVAVLGAAASSGVLFVSTVATASIRAQSSADCAEASMPQWTSYAAPQRTAAANTAANGLLHGVTASHDPFAVDLARTNVGATTVTLYSRAGALDHVHRLTPDTGAAGAWLPQLFARQAHARPGTVLRTATGGTIQVAGIYRDLAPNPFETSDLAPYWCTWKDLVLQRIDYPTPPLLIADVATVASARPQYVQVDAFSPIPDLTITTARSADHAVKAAFAAHGAGPRFGRPIPSELSDPLASKIGYAELVQHGLVGSVVPIAAAGSVVALLLVLGAGAFWASHRAREIRLLTSRGVSPAQLGVKAVLETAPAALLGLGTGVLVAEMLTRSVGPSPAFTPHATLYGAVVALGALLVALAGIFVIGAHAGRDRPPAHRRRRVVSHVPRELALLGVAGWLAATLRSSSGVVVEHTIVTVRPALLLFPILATTGVLVLFARILSLLRRPVATSAPRTSGAAYLTLRRVVRAPAIALGLLIGTALPISLLTYAGTVDVATAHEVTAKYETNVGAPHALLIVVPRGHEPELHGTGTNVVGYGPSQATVPGGDEVSVLGVDPATFGRFAFLDSGQRADVARLHGDAAVLVNARGLGDPSSVRIGATRIGVRVVAHQKVFPGLTAGQFPMLVVDRDRLSAVDPNADRSNLVYTDDAHLTRALNTIVADGCSLLSQVDPSFRLGNSGLLPVTWIFGYLRALALLIGAVALAGLVFALAARTRQRTVAYVMSRRMGMRQGVHVRSLLLELGVLVGVGWLAGAAAGAGGFATIMSALDVYPQLPPGASLVLPAAVLLGSAVAVVLVVVFASLATHRMAERCAPADVLRLE